MIEEEYVEAVDYTRYSSHSQRDVSIDQQRRAIEAFAKRNGLRLVAHYEDKAMTGTNDRRPAFQQMIKDAEKANWKYVIVYSLDRFARDRYDSAVYKRQLKNCGVKVLSAMENISDDPSGILMESLLEGLAEYYSKELSQKIRRGMADNAQRCMVNGSLPLGYVRGADGRYAIDEAEAAVVRQIYSRVSDGERFCDIIDDLNNRSILTKSKKHWNRSSFNKLLSNERYIGTYIYGDVRIPGGIPPIIDADLFEAVQHRLGQKPNPRTSAVPQRRRRENSIYLLTGKIYCGSCHEAMTGISGHSKTGSPYYYYVCKKKRESHTCDKRNVPRDYIEQMVAKALRDTMLTDAAIEALADAAMEYQRNNETKFEVQTLKQRLSEVEVALKNVMAAIEAGIITQTTKARLEELEEEKRRLTNSLAAVQETADDISRPEIVAALKMFQEGNVEDKSYQEALIDTFLIRVYVYDDKLKFIFNLGGKEKPTEIPFDIDSIAEEEASITDTSLHQIALYEHFGHPVIMIGDMFVGTIAIESPAK